MEHQSYFYVLIYSYQQTHGNVPLYNLHLCYQRLSNTTYFVAIEDSNLSEIVNHFDSKLNFMLKYVFLTVNKFLVVVLFMTEKPI